MSEKQGRGEMFSQKMLTKGQNMAGNVGARGQRQEVSIWNNMIVG